MKLAHGWLIVPLLAACAASGPRWEKAGAGQTAIDEDEQRCRVEARLAPQPRQGPTSASSAAPLEGGQERDAQDEQRVVRCMRDKGYSEKR
jgi:hypothetical protein